MGTIGAYVSSGGSLPGSSGYTGGSGRDGSSSGGSSGGSGSSGGGSSSTTAPKTESKTPQRGETISHYLSRTGQSVSQGMRSITKRSSPSSNSQQPRGGEKISDYLKRTQQTPGQGIGTVSKTGFGSGKTEAQEALEKRYQNQYVTGRRPDDDKEVPKEDWKEEVARRQSYEDSQKPKSIGRDSTGTVTSTSKGLEELKGQTLTSEDAIATTSDVGTSAEILANREARRSVGQGGDFGRSVAEKERAIVPGAYSKVDYVTGNIIGEGNVEAERPIQAGAYSKINANGDVIGEGVVDTKQTVNKREDKKGITGFFDIMTGGFITKVQDTSDKIVESSDGSPKLTALGTVTDTITHPIQAISDGYSTIKTGTGNVLRPITSPIVHGTVDFLTKTGDKLDFGTRKWEQEHLPEWFIGKADGEKTDVSERFENYLADKPEEVIEDVAKVYTYGKVMKGLGYGGSYVKGKVVDKVPWIKQTLQGGGFKEKVLDVALTTPITLTELSIFGKIVETTDPLLRTNEEKSAISNYNQQDIKEAVFEANRAQDTASVEGMGFVNKFITASAHEFVPTLQDKDVWRQEIKNIAKDKGYDENNFLLATTTFRNEGDVSQTLKLALPEMQANVYGGIATERMLTRKGVTIEQFKNLPFKERIFPWMGTKITGGAVEGAGVTKTIWETFPKETEVGLPFGLSMGVGGDKKLPGFVDVPGIPGYNATQDPNANITNININQTEFDKIKDNMTLGTNEVRKYHMPVEGGNNVETFYSYRDEIAPRKVFNPGKYLSVTAGAGIGVLSATGFGVPEAGLMGTKGGFAAVTGTGYVLDFPEAPSDIGTGVFYPSSGNVVAVSPSLSPSVTSNKNLVGSTSEFYGVDTAKNIDFSYDKSINKAFTQDIGSMSQKKSGRSKSTSTQFQVQDQLTLQKTTQSQEQFQFNLQDELQGQFQEQKEEQKEFQDIFQEQNQEQEQMQDQFQDVMSTQMTPKFFPFFWPGGGGRGGIGVDSKGKGKKKLGYSASLQAKMLGIYGDAPTPIVGGAYSGQQFRPILGTAPTKKKKAKRFNPMDEFTNTNNQPFKIKKTKKGSTKRYKPSKNMFEDFNKKFSPTKKKRKNKKPLLFNL